MFKKTLWTKASVLCRNGKISSVRCLISVQPYEGDTTNIPKTTKVKHCFHNLYPWGRLSNFANYLKENIIYNKDGLIAVNKPYGVKVRTFIPKDSVNQEVKHTSTYASQEDFRYSVEECLPVLKAHFNAPQLEILKGPERYASGVVLLGCNEKVCKKVERSKALARSKRIPQLIYWGLTKGCPVVSALNERVGMELVDLKCSGEKQPVIVKNFSKGALRKRKVKPVVVEYRTIAVNREISTALIEIAASSVKWHFLRVYAASQAASILGDMLYGSRGKMLLGRPVNINPHNIGAFNVQPLPELICRSLGLPFDVSAHMSVPTMLHFRTMVLPEYFEDEDLVINAPPPTHFKWACTQFGFVPPD